MWYFNLAVSRIFDLLISPFQSFHPFWSLCIFSLITGIFILVIFRYTSNQDGIREAKNKIKAHFLEVRLFNDNLSILLSAQKNILLYNIQYLKYALKPVLFMIVPVSLIIIQLNGWFAYRPLKIGESAVVTITADNQGTNILSKITIEPDKGLMIETPPLVIPDEREINWRIRANKLGKHHLTLGVAGHAIKKVVVVSDKRLSRVSRRKVNSRLFGQVFLNPGEKPIAQNSFVERIEVNYPSRSIQILGWKTHWLIVFFVLIILFVFGLKRLVRVEI